MTHLTAAEEAALNLSPRAKLEILGAILLALFLFALDQTVVGDGAAQDHHGPQGNNLYTWAVTIYLLTSTISGPIYGKLSDLFGRRPIVIFAVGLFLVSSALCGLSQEMWQFILFRGLQGLGGGAVFPVALAVVADLYTPAERGKYLGFFGAVFGLSSLIGPGLGGFITDTFGWHWIFFVNVPIGLDLAGHPVAAPAGDQAARGGAQHRLHRRGRLRARHRAVPHRPDQQADAAEWTDPAVGGLILLGLAFGAALPVDRVAGPRADRAAQPLPHPDVHDLRRGDVPRGLRVLHARSSSCPAGSRPSPGPAPPSRATTSCRCSPA